MEMLGWKTRVAVLWMVAAVAMSAHTILAGLDPVAMKKVAEAAATAGQGEWVMMALFWLGPLWLGFASVTVRGPANLWVNFGGAGVFTVLNVWHFFICGVPLLSGGPFAKPLAHHILLVGSTVAATVLIAWHAWKWPKEGV